MYRGHDETSQRDAEVLVSCFNQRHGSEQLAAEKPHFIDFIAFKGEGFPQSLRTHRNLEVCSH